MAVSMMGMMNGNSLVFYSLEFLFMLLPFFILVFYLTPVSRRKVMLLAGSLLLYGMAEPLSVVLLVLQGILGWLCCKRMVRHTGTSRKLFCGIGVAAALAVLCFYKAAGFAKFGIGMPLGISFYTFRLLSVELDTYRGEETAENGIDFLCYVCLFPQLPSGPILRFHEMKPWLTGEDRLLAGSRNCLAEIGEGLTLLIPGLAFKVLLADPLSTLWVQLNTIGYESISTPLAWLGAITFSLELYLDFQGYTLMSGGLCRMVGLPAVENFRNPYLADSVSDFWRKWHITLGSFFRDYVYIPLGGSRVSTVKKIRNLMIVWILTGIWHGNGWNFCIWGLVLGCIIVLEKFTYGAVLEQTKVLKHLYVWIMIPITWVIFAIPDLRDLATYGARMFPFFGIGSCIRREDVLDYGMQYLPVLAASILVCVPALRSLYYKSRSKWWVQIMLFVIFWFCMYRTSLTGANPFLYYQF